MKTKKPNPAHPVDLTRLVRRIIVEVHGNMTPMQAIYYCMKVAQQGEISGPKDRKQHCYHTTFKNGAEVACVKRGKSERFIVSHKQPNDTAQQRATNNEPSREDATGALAAAPCSARLDVRRWIERDGTPIIYQNGGKHTDFEVERLFPIRFKVLQTLVRLTEKLRSRLSHIVYGLQNK